MELTVTKLRKGNERRALCIISEAGRDIARIVIINEKEAELLATGSAAKSALYRWGQEGFMPDTGDLENIEMTVVKPPHVDPFDTYPGGEGNTSEKY